jgi:hypothetical protein
VIDRVPLDAGSDTGDTGRADTGLKDTADTGPRDTAETGDTGAVPESGEEYRYRLESDGYPYYLSSAFGLDPAAMTFVSDERIAAVDAFVNSGEATHDVVFTAMRYKLNGEEAEAPLVEGSLIKLSPGDQISDVRLEYVVSNGSSETAEPAPDTGLPADSAEPVGSGDTGDTAASPAPTELYYLYGFVPTVTVTISALPTTPDEEGGRER